MVQGGDVEYAVTKDWHTREIRKKIVENFHYLGVVFVSNRNKFSNVCLKNA